MPTQEFHIPPETLRRLRWMLLALVLGTMWMGNFTAYVYLLWIVESDAASLGGTLARAFLLSLVGVIMVWYYAARFGVKARLQIAEEERRLTMEGRQWRTMNLSPTPMLEAELGRYGKLVALRVYAVEAGHTMTIRLFDLPTVRTALLARGIPETIKPYSRIVWPLNPLRDRPILTLAVLIGMIGSTGAVAYLLNPLTSLVWAYVLVNVYLCLHFWAQGGDGAKRSAVSWGILSAGMALLYAVMIWWLPRQGFNF